MKRTIAILSLALAMTFTAISQTPSNPVSGAKLNKQQLLSLIATAKTPAEHQRIAHYYEFKAQDFLAQSNEHQQMAEQYKKNAITANSKFAKSTVDHCEYFAQSFKADSVKMQELAQIHEQMAKDAAQR